MREYDLIAVVRYTDGTSIAGRGRLQMRRQNAWFSFEQPHSDEPDLFLFDGKKDQRTGYYQFPEFGGNGNLTLRRTSQRVFKGGGRLDCKDCTASLYLWPKN